MTAYDALTIVGIPMLAFIVAIAAGWAPDLWEHWRGPAARREANKGR